MIAVVCRDHFFECSVCGSETGGFCATGLKLLARADVPLKPKVASPHKMRFWFQGEEIVPYGPYKFEMKNPPWKVFDPSPFVQVQEFDLTCKLTPTAVTETYAIDYAETYTEAS